jgi:putative sporulation protein YyaC
MMKTTQYIRVEDSETQQCLTNSVYSAISKAGGRPIVILCIGTDRCTGDSLGPLVGSKLSRRQYHDVYVYGTLEDTVHAVNLGDTVSEIIGRHDNPFILAIDASLGNTEHVGCIRVSSGPLAPGSGAGKDIGKVGDAHIAGIVNKCDLGPMAILMNTRLSVVMALAESIANSIIIALWRRKSALGGVSLCPKKS